MTNGGPIKVQYHDHGILLSWPTDDPRLHRAIHLPVDDAINLAQAVQRVTDEGQVDERTKVFRVQWYDDGVLLSHQIAGDDWTRIHLPMSGARVMADAILRCGDRARCARTPRRRRSARRPRRFRTLIRTKRTAVPSASGRPFVVGDPYAGIHGKGRLVEVVRHPVARAIGDRCRVLDRHVLDRAAQVDGWTITLLVVGFLPWLRTVFESIEFPGGGSVKWRQAVEAEQGRQAEDIQAFRFLLARFLNKPERELLQWLAYDESFSIEEKSDPIWQHLDSLRRLGLISMQPLDFLSCKRRPRPSSGPPLRT